MKNYIELLEIKHPRLLKYIGYYAIFLTYVFTLLAIGGLILQQIIIPNIRGIEAIFPLFFALLIPIVLFYFYLFRFRFWYKNLTDKITLKDLKFDFYISLPALIYFCFIIIGLPLLYLAYFNYKKIQYLKENQIN